MNKLYETNKKYLLSHPWARHYKSMSGRCSRQKCYGKLGIKNFLTTELVKQLWFRDKAYLLKRPSIDRKNPKGDYIFENCRFIELSDNARMARLGKPLLKITKEKISRANKGKHLSVKTEFKKGHVFSEKTKKKISKSVTTWWARRKEKEEK